MDFATAVRTFARDTLRFGAGEITAEMYRAGNRQRREALGDDEWERAKLAAFAAIDRNGG